MEQEIATQVVGLGGTNDFSLWQLFLRADFVVKTVILLLIASSIFSWALIFDKIRLFRRIDQSTKSFEDKFWKSKSAEAFYKSLPNKTDDPLTTIFKSAMSELIKTKSKSCPFNPEYLAREFLSCFLLEPKPALTIPKKESVSPKLNTGSSNTSISTIEDITFGGGKNDPGRI